MAFLEDLLGYDPESERLVNRIDVVRSADDFSEPITLADLKLALKLPDDTTEDSHLTLLAVAARRRLENLTGYAFMQQTLIETRDRVGKLIDLTIKPAISITSIKTVYDWTVDTQVTVSSASYLLKRNIVAARTTWPVHRGFQSFEITYKAGFGVNDETLAAVANARALVPAELKVAISQLAGHWYENREGQAADAAYYALLAQTGLVPGNVFDLICGYIDYTLKA